MRSTFCVSATVPFVPVCSWTSEGFIIEKLLLKHSARAAFVGGWRNKYGSQKQSLLRLVRAFSDILKIRSDFRCETSATGGCNSQCGLTKSSLAAKFTAK